MSIANTLKAAFKFPVYVIEIGVLSANKRKSKIDLGLTNADLMFIHENGSPLRHIPARPVIQMTIDWARSEGLINKTVDKMFDVLASTGDYNKVDKVVNAFCIELQNHARSIIYDNDGQLAPNAPSTVARKGFNHPLFVTGDLARSITCQAIRLK